MNDTLWMLEMLINVTELTQKWMMWTEMRSPNQSTYLQSIYQLRDSHSHLVKMFANGFQKKYFDMEGKPDYTGFFDDSDARFQLKEALGHAFRAFFDCADYIHIKIAHLCLINKGIY